MSEPVSNFAAMRPRLHYLEWNSAGDPDLLLLHGGSANAWWWAPVASELGHDFRLVAPDQRGHGDSEWVRPPAYARADYAADGEALLDACDLHNPIVVGHSMGGINAVVLAARCPAKLRAVVAIDIAVTSSPARDRFMRRLQSLPTVVYPDLATATARFRLMPDEGRIAPGRLHVIAQKSIRPVPEGGGYTHKFDRESFHGSDGVEVAATLAKVSVPILLVRGQHSRILTAEGARLAQQANPLLKLVVVPDSHHHILLESPEFLAQEIRNFISTLPPP